MTDSTTKTETERKELLASLGLNPDAPGLSVTRAKTRAAGLATAAVGEPDPHRIPAGEIEFAPALLDNFPDLDGAAMTTVSRYLFDMFKSPTKDHERHALLHRRISEFIQQVRRSRQTQGLVSADPTKEKIKASKEHRDLAALLAAQGITAESLAKLIKAKEESTES